MFKNACSEAKAAGVKFVVLLNHYGKCDSRSCGDNMSARGAAKRVKELDGCSDMNITWYEGHDHANKVVSEGSMWGMDVSAYGMTSGHNHGTFYIFSTKDGKYKVYEFQKEDILACKSAEECINSKKYTAMYDDGCHSEHKKCNDH